MTAQQQEQQEPPMSPSALDGFGGEGASSGAPPAEVTPEKIEEIRRLVAYNPILTGPLLEQIKREDPDMYNYINGDPEKLLDAFGQVGAADEPSAALQAAPPTSSLPPAFPPLSDRQQAAIPVTKNVTRPTTETQTFTKEEQQTIEGVCFLPLLLR